MPSILIVDDDPTIRGMFARALKSLGDVEQAESGSEALRLLAAKKYSVVLLDLHMPVVDGFVVLQNLATKQGPNGDTPVYLITADTSDEARIKALRRHAVFFLSKPVPIATLISLVDSTLRMVAQRASPTTSRLTAQAPIGGDTASGRSSFNPRPPAPRAPAPAAPERISAPPEIDRTAPRRPPGTPPPPAPPPISDKAPPHRATPLPRPPPSRTAVDTPVPDSPFRGPDSPLARPKKP